MAKSTVDNIVAKIKRRSDYDISDTDLDTLIIDIINDSLKVIKQLFLDHNLLDEITAQDSFDTVANQEYVDIATETIDFDQPLVLTERTNDSPIGIISLKEYRESYPDPTANTASSPDVAAFGENRIYFGPTPSSVITIYLDYIKLIPDVVSEGNMPFEAKYDPLIIAMGKAELLAWLDSKNSVGITAAEKKVETLKHELIIGAAKNIGMNMQSQSRREGLSYPSPRVAE